MTITEDEATAYTLALSETIESDLRAALAELARALRSDVTDEDWDEDGERNARARLNAALRDYNRAVTLGLGAETNQQMLLTYHMALTHSAAITAMQSARSDDARGTRTVKREVDNGVKLMTLFLKQYETLAREQGRRRRPSAPTARPASRRRRLSAKTDNAARIAPVKRRSPAKTKAKT